MEEKPYCSSPLGLEGAVNVRDLGGYPCKGGGFTVSHRLLRGDGPYALTEGDLVFLYEYGVRAAIDLRSERELLRMPSRLRGWRDVKFYSIPLQDNIFSRGEEEKFPATMLELYLSLLDDCGHNVARVMGVLAGCPKGCVFFNCTAGKDRTGIIAMLLLALAGVDDAHIIADYAASEGYLARLFGGGYEAHKGMLGPREAVPAHVLGSRPEDMAAVLRHLRQRYGGAEGYLLAQGLTTAQLEAVRGRLVAGGGGPA